ncbi:MAG TPA: hypothetical protein VI076_09650, partial [Actinopolymorphaceae bacterium]
MVALLRSARLTCWTNSWLSGATSLEEADEAIRGSDAAHHLIGLADEPEPVPLLLGLGALRRQGTRACTLALPVPGDPLGLAGPRGFTEAALEAGEGVIFEGSRLGLVPHVVGAGVQWRVYEAHPAPPIGFADAATELTRALHDAIESFGKLEIARWRPEIADALMDLRGLRRSSAGGLSPGYEPRAEHLAMRARTCLLIHELASEDDGGVRTSHEAEVRRKAFRDLESA